MYVMYKYNIISSDHSAVAYLIAFEDLLFQNSLVVLCSPRFTPLYMCNFIFVFLKLILLDFIYVMYIFMVTTEICKYPNLLCLNSSGRIVKVFYICSLSNFIYTMEALWYNVACSIS